MSDISATLHAEVVLRAGNRCEFCRLSQLGQEVAFHRDPGGPAMPTILRNGPYRFYFYSHEPNEPPHVHVDRDDLSAKGKKKGPA
ncbi:MAG TPA: DUF4160 domain-containing protein [Gemmataceae bacterium]|nr:DUF4160 domain-containing protein [Gemmataceae bacterium]